MSILTMTEIRKPGERMTFETWFNNHFVSGNIQSTTLHERDRIIAREAWDAALTLGSTGQQQERMTVYEPGLG